jgi:hypothetical protein
MKAYIVAMMAGLFATSAYAYDIRLDSPPPINYVGRVNVSWEIVPDSKFRCKQQTGVGSAIEITISYKDKSMYYDGVKKGDITQTNLSYNVIKNEFNNSETTVVHFDFAAGPGWYFNATNSKFIGISGKIFNCI